MSKSTTRAVVLRRARKTLIKRLVRAAFCGLHD